MNTRGTFVFSLDYELYWGVWDSQDSKYFEKLNRVNNEVIPRLLSLSNKYNIHLTFATVGSLMCKDLRDWEQVVNTQNYRLSYTDERLNILKNENLKIQNPETLFAYETVLKISEYEQHEIASHTFGHIYCNEEGLKQEEICIDFKIFNSKFKELLGSQPISIVFPRNQYNPDVLKISKENGIKVFRGNETSWIYSSTDRKSYRNKLKRVLRLLDTYINMGGSYTLKPKIIQGMVNIPSSRFFRPFNTRLVFMESLKLRRIFKQMDSAKKGGTVFHLWCHPHNLIEHQDEVFNQLEAIFKYAKQLNLVSLTMSECAQKYYPTDY